MARTCVLHDKSLSSLIYVFWRDLRNPSSERTPLLFYASVEVPGKMRRGQELGMKMGFHFQRLDSKRPTI